MSRQQASSMARRQAAAPIVWPKDTLILVNPDPAVARRQLAERDNTSGAVLPAHGASAATGVDLMLKAAAAGSQDALRYVIDHPDVAFQASGPQEPSPHANRG
ncbi:hypothetical protein [Burkholderia gladioli]|uniref:hypothetical protein n=1 Tax=Burkholderia gladioli TaxID=28095 RepID=UPI0016414944|nr:hypothetical protein [Burkholderia gladioli]